MEFQVLGPVEVTDDGRPLRLGGARTRAVLACLLANANRMVAADQLLDELWPQLSPLRAAANLQVRLTELRKALRSVGEGERLVSRPPGYVLQVARDELDAWRFEELVAAGHDRLSAEDAIGALALLDEALALWRGPALAGLEELHFAAAERTRLEEERLGALELRLDARLASGRHREAIPELEGLTAEHPLRERFWAQRMLALYRAGRQADALRAYREVRAILVEQLGIEPGHELRELEAGILRQDAELSHRPGGERPARPETRYAASDGIHIAYQLLGDGRPDILFIPGAISHLDLLWEDPETATFFRRLAGPGRLILFDKRDTGLSDRAPVHSSLEERMDDVLAVMDAAGSSEAVLFGYSEGGPMSILFAATYPERVSALILAACTARYRPAPDYPCGRGSDQMFDALLDIAEHRWGQGETIDWFLPSRAHVPGAREMIGRFERMSASPSAFVRTITMIREIDVRAVLPTVHAPTLVIQRLDDVMTPPCHGRYLAEHIAGARYFEQPGDHSMRFAASGDTDRLLQEIADFLAGAPRPGGTDHALTTILVVEPLIDGMSRHVAACRGRLRSPLLATFEAPGQAIRCARAVREDASNSGVALQAGVHTGEVALAGEAIKGPSVEIAASIARLARPGEILVSRTVKDLVVGSGTDFAERGSHDVTGTSERWPLYAVLGTLDSHAGNPPTRSATSG